MAFEALFGGGEATDQQYEYSALFNIFHSCLENAPQIVLQMYIILTTYDDDGKQDKYLNEVIKQLIGKNLAVCIGKSQEWLVALSLFGLSGAISNVKLWTLRGEELGLNNLFYWIPMRISCIIHVSLRLVTYALLSAQYLHYAAIILPLQFFSNLFIGQRICQDVHLNVVNAALSMVAPAAYNLADQGGNSIHHNDKFRFPVFFCNQYNLGLFFMMLLSIFL